MSKTSTVHARVPEETRERFEKLAKSMKRSKSFLAAEAIEQYIAANAWQIEEIEEALAEARRPGAHFVPHEEVEAWVEALERDEDTPMPKGRPRSEL